MNRNACKNDAYNQGRPRGYHPDVTSGRNPFAFIDDHSGAEARVSAEALSKMALVNA